MTAATHEEGRLGHAECRSPRAAIRATFEGNVPKERAYPRSRARDHRTFREGLGQAPRRITMVQFKPTGRKNVAASSRPSSSTKGAHDTARPVTLRGENGDTQPPGGPPGSPFDILQEAAQAIPSALLSRPIRGLSVVLVGSAAVTFVAGLVGHWRHAPAAIWVARISFLLLVLAWLGILLIALVSQLRQLADVPGSFLRHLSQRYPIETRAIEALVDRFSRPQLEEAEARIALTIAQLRQRLPLLVPVDKLATPFTVLASYFYAKQLFGFEQDAQSWPAWLLMGALGLSCTVVVFSIAAQSLERSALLLQRAVARKRDETGKMEPSVGESSRGRGV